MSTPYYPPPAFYFSVALIGSGKRVVDASFQEVSGIEAQFEVERTVEGGENRFAHNLPQRSKFSNLVLKRGFVTSGSFLAQWVSDTLGSNLSAPIVTRDLLVTLLNAKGQPLVTWNFVNAYPLRWDVASLNSMDNKILTETLELSYNYFVRTDASQ
jgi:phage tail-like protein